MELKVPPPLQALIAALVMAGIHHFTNQTVVVFRGQLTLAVACALLGLFVVFCALWVFRQSKTTVNPLRPEQASSLVTTGIFRVSRNPMYLGLMLILTGIAVYFGVIVNVVVLALFVAYMTYFQIKPEERAMQRLFGAEYENYVLQVRRWL